MQRFFKILSSLVLTLILLAGSTILLFAWNAPEITKDYVEADEEFRAVWVCTVSNMDVDVQNGTSESAINAWKERYLTILNNSIDAGMNAIIFQVSPCNDAFYPSKYKPWSEYLAGYGVDPGWDPVEWMLEVTHEAGLEYHAWFNPYRASTASLTYDITKYDNASRTDKLYDYDEKTIYDYKQEYFGNLKSICEQKGTLVDNPIFESGDILDHNVVYGTEGKFVLNPASPSTIKHLEDTFNEFVTNYDVDGVHFDDYFYPNDTTYEGTLHPEYKQYTFSTEPDIDMNDYNSYKTTGGTLSIYDWRRENVNDLIETLSDLIREKNKNKKVKCAFGISPAARWAPKLEYCSASPHRGAEGGMDSNCNGYYSYSDLYADTRKWVLEGWLDYILPQNYTQLGNSTVGVPSGDYDDINNWWSNVIEQTDCKLYVGTPLYQVDSWVAASTSTNLEIYYQIKWNYEKSYAVDGYVMFRYKSMLSGSSRTAMKAVKKNLWQKAALTPIYASYEYDSVDDYAKIKELKNDPTGLYTITFEKVEGAKAYAVLEDGKVISRVLSGANEISFMKEEGKTYTFATYGQNNQMHESTDIVNFDNVKMNEAPVVVLNTKIEKNYLIQSKINLDFTVTDSDDDPLIYTLYATQKNKKYSIATDAELVGNTITATYECFAIEMADMKFVLEVSDGFQKTIFESDLFNIVKKLPEPPHEHNFVEGECVCGEKDPNYHEHNFIEGKCACGEKDPNYEEPQIAKKKCGKKSSDLIVATIGMISLFGLILRKKD